MTTRRSATKDVHRDGNSCNEGRARDFKKTLDEPSGASKREGCPHPLKNLRGCRIVPRFTVRQPPYPRLRRRLGRENRTAGSGQLEWRICPRIAAVGCRDQRHDEGSGAACRRRAAALAGRRAGCGCQQPLRERCPPQGNAVLEVAERGEVIELLRWLHRRGGELRLRDHEADERSTE